jgi:hypothetical protein
MPLFIVLIGFSIQVPDPGDPDPVEVPAPEFEVLNVENPVSRGLDVVVPETDILDTADPDPPGAETAWPVVIDSGEGVSVTNISPFILGWIEQWYL